MAAWWAADQRRPGQLGAWLLIGLWCAVVPAIAAPPQELPPNSGSSWSLAGQFLIASRRLAEPTFARTVILLLAHRDDGGAMGLVVNRVLGTMRIDRLMSGFGIHTRNRQPLDVYLGGPVEMTRGFVLHSADYRGTSTRKLLRGISLSIGTDVMQALADRRGPKQHRVLLGYAGWSAGQLEHEMARGDWLLAPADPLLLFSDDPGSIWERAVQRAGLPL
jgi:putative transcriptional regulator